MLRTFTYEAVDSGGKRRRGSIQANSRDEAILALKKQGLFATSMDEGEIPSVAPAGEGLQEILDYFGFTFVSQKDMALYTRKFSALINAGIIYSEIFDILHDESENNRLRRISGRIAKELRGGKKVTEALSLYPNVFNKVFRSMVAAGEQTGRLDEIMARLAQMYEDEFELRQSILSRLYFPIIYLIVGLAVIAAAIFIIPRMFPTAYAIFPKGLFFNVVVFYVMIAAVVLFIRTKPGYVIFRSIIAYIPPFGGVLRKMSLARFSRLLSAMYSSGVPVLTGLDIAGETLIEPELQRGIAHVKGEINRGSDITSALASSNVFPKSLRGMVRTGEVSGNIEGMLDKAAEYYELEIKTQSSMLATAFTFLIMLLVLGTLAIFVISAWSGYFGFIDSLISE